MSEQIDLQTVLDEAAKAFATHQQQVNEALEQYDREREERLQQEKDEILEWLRAWMPSPLIQYVVLAHYRRKDARYHGETRRGTWLWLRLPDAYPIRFNIKLWRDKEFEFVADDARFCVASDAYIGRTEEGLPYLGYRWSEHWDPEHEHAKFFVAVGHAVQLWQENGERLLAELEQARHAPEPEPEVEEPDPVIEKPIDVRTVEALEKIAEAVDAMAHFQYSYG